MLKLNTVATVFATLLLGILCWLGKGIWEDVATIKSSNTTQAVQMQTLTRELDDHESRIRQAEKDVTVLQQGQREDPRTARSPRMSDNKP